MEAQYTFPEVLQNHLPEGLQLNLYHVRSSRVKCMPIFLTPPASKPTPTTLESHFLAVEHDSVLVFAIEILGYTLTKTGERYFFVTKADSSGYLPLTVSSFTAKDTPATRKSVLRVIATAFIQYVLKEFGGSSCGGKSTLCLFARSQGQYLFPDSASNKLKHLLNDTELITWWCKVLNPILQDDTRGPRGYLLVPGLTGPATRSFLPIPADRWTVGHPFQIEKSTNLTVREVIPVFPDDPKARFLNDLCAGENKKAGTRSQKWTSISTVDSFWEHMSFRQECSLGHSIGFMWIVMRNPADEPRNVVLSTSTSKKAPQIPREESDKDLVLATEMQTGISSFMSSVATLDEKNYQRAIESLLNTTNFASRENAGRYSAKWIAGIKVLLKTCGTSELPSWGARVTGRQRGSVPITSNLATEAASDVNILQPRKRKAEGTLESEKSINMLGPGLVRKKSKLA